MTLRGSDLQSDSDLDSIRNSCDVDGWMDGFTSGYRKRQEAESHQLLSALK